MTSYNLDEKSGLFGMFSLKNPSKLIKKDNFLELRHFNSFNSYKCVVQEVNENSIKILSSELVPDTNMFPGDHVVASFSSSQEVFIISGDLTNIINLNPLEASIKVERIEKLKDLRKNERYSVSLASNVKILGVLEAKFSIIKNISHSGVKLICKEDIMMEDIIEPTILLDKTTKLIFKGRIVRKNKLEGFFEYGVEIVEVSELNLKNLHRYLNQDI